MIYIYARVSTKEQNVEQQVAYLMAKYTTHDEVIFEKSSGKTLDRPRFDSMRRKLRPQDTVIVQDLSRLGRNTRAVLEFLEECTEHDITLIIDDIGADTSTPSGKLVLTILAAFAEMQRTQMLEKQAIGIERAKSEGKYEGKKGYSTTFVSNAIRLVDEGMSVKDAAKQLKISPNTLYIWRRERGA